MAEHKIVLLANVGNSDLEANDKNAFPLKPDGSRMSPRELGEHVRDNYAAYKEKIYLPLIEPTLEYIRDAEGIALPKDKSKKPNLSRITVYLFASNQNESTVINRDDWLKDTMPLAEVIQRYLQETYQIPKKQVRIIPIEGNPADYSNALSFHAETLAKIKQEIGDSCRVYIEVSGGTPAMTAMLILMGVEVFGQDVVTLYKDRSTQQPERIDVSEQLYARKTREILRVQLSRYAYAAAIETMEQNESLIFRNEVYRHAVRHLLRYADRRLAFDFNRAREELSEVKVTGEKQSKLRYWRNELQGKSREITLAEVIHGARIKLDLWQFAEFTQYLFRFQEEAFREMAERMGIEKGKEYLSQTWLKNNESLTNYLQSYRRNQKGKPLDTPQPVDTTRSLNRYSLGAIVEYYTSTIPEWQKWQHTAEALFRLSSVADLRNKGISGHGFEGIGREDIEHAYEGKIDDILGDLEGIYESLFERKLSSNPFDEVNALIIDLMGASA